MANLHSDENGDETRGGISKTRHKMVCLFSDITIICSVLNADNFPRQNSLDSWIPLNICIYIYISDYKFEYF